MEAGAKTENIKEHVKTSKNKRRKLKKMSFSTAVTWEAVLLRRKREVTRLRFNRISVYFEEQVC